MLDLNNIRLGERNGPIYYQIQTQTGLIAGKIQYDTDELGLRSKINNIELKLIDKTCDNAVIAISHIDHNEKIIVIYFINYRPVKHVHHELKYLAPLPELYNFDDFPIQNIPEEIENLTSLSELYNFDNIPIQII
jgi:hypothetical protein